LDEFERQGDFGRTWAQPLLGMQASVFVSPKLRLFARGDIGGFGLSGDKDLSGNAQVGLGYAVGNNTDLNLSWQVKSDGLVYDARKESEAGSLRSRTGQIMQSRVKSIEALKELSYIIKNVGFVVKETGGPAHPFEFYILPKKSDFYFVPYGEGESGLRFMYVWAKRGLSKNPSSHESGKGWKLNVAEQDYRNIMPLGNHMATATLDPIAESEYGSKKPRSEYVSRFKFDVLPGLNIYVINYVFRRDRPEIFVRRLEIEGTRDEPVRAVKRITEVYRVYGE